MPKYRYPQLEFDRLQMYFGVPHIVDLPNAPGSITIFEPSMADYVHIGENRFYATFNIFTTNTTSYRLPLWEMGLDWNVISDFDLFRMLYLGIDKEVSDLFFHDLDFSQFQEFEKELDGKMEKILYDPINDIEINEDVYQHIAQYLRTMWNSFPEEKITTDPVMKKWFITRDKRQKEIDADKKKNGEDLSFSLQPLISACVNHPGFKYKLKELSDVGICEFFDSVKRLQLYESSTALMKGMYSGFVDGSKIKPEEYNFMRKI